ncbi:MAG: hypothetical protein AAF386_08245 [Pseudomonadota bacterium]
MPLQDQTNDWNEIMNTAFIIASVLVVAIVIWCIRDIHLEKRKYKSLTRAKDGSYTWQDKSGAWQVSASYPFSGMVGGTFGTSHDGGVGGDIGAGGE